MAHLGCFVCRVWRQFVKIYKNIGLNFIGNAWSGVLIVLTTPWYISMLGMEGYGLVGFWQLLLYIFLIFDFGLGTSLVKEFAAYRGLNCSDGGYRDLLFSIEKICLAVAVVLMAAILMYAPWIASVWLRLEQISPSDADLALRFMSLSLGSQLLNALYSNGLAGLQKHGAMNFLQMLGNGMRYLGGGGVLYFNGGIVYFFAFQGLSALAVVCLTRVVLLKAIGTKRNLSEAKRTTSIVGLARFSSGMFATSLLGMLLSNTDRIMLSKLVPTSEFGRYTLALAAAGFLQMIVFSFFRTYFPMFAEMKASGEAEKLKAAYFHGCRLVGMAIIPAAAIGWTFSGELIQIWIGREDLLTAQVFRFLIVGTACSSLMWLPAAYQQALGWTSLHISLMAVALLLGTPCALLAIDQFGTVGATSIMLVHGLIEITLGLWLMNRVVFPGENLKWYRGVLIPPLAISLPLVAISKHFMPEQLARVESTLWIGGTCIVLFACIVAMRNRLSQ
jgi:O-antigen/teichoic acid export membrane protein